MKKYQLLLSFRAGALITASMSAVTQNALPLKTKITNLVSAEAAANSMYTVPTKILSDDEGLCGCDASNNGQYCGPSGSGCDVPPTPMNDQGCGWKTGPPGCDYGKCCTKIFIIN